jgi:hypothetical protein
MEKTPKSGNYKGRKTRSSGAKSKLDKDEFFSRINRLSYDYKSFSKAIGLSENTVKAYNTKPIPLIVERILFLLEQAIATKRLLETNYQFDNNGTSKSSSIPGRKNKRDANQPNHIAKTQTA